MANLNGHGNGLYSYDSFSHKKGNSGKFLWWCSGAEQELLKQYPTEHAKYSGLGGVLLATFALAALSSGYALYSIFGNAGIAILFALVWGLIIFNFDRFLVSTMRKYGVSGSQQVKMAIPRVLLAILIGITIARPLELKIFEKEIQVKVKDNMHKKILLNDSLVNVEGAGLIQTATLERDRLVQRRNQIQDTLHQLQASYVAEADGTGGSGRRGIEKLTRLKMEAFDQSTRQFQPELVDINRKIQLQDSILLNSRRDIEGRKKEYQAALQNNIGFLERNKALSDLADEESSVWWTSLLLSLLIILIETGPILSKLIMQPGPYDVALAEKELTQMAESENSMRKDKANRFDKNKQAFASQQEVSAELIGKLTEARKKHIREQIEKWEKGEGPNRRGETLEQLLKRLQEELAVQEDDLL